MPHLLPHIVRDAIALRPYAAAYTRDPAQASASCASLRETTPTPSGSAPFASVNRQQTPARARAKACCASAPQSLAADYLIEAPADSAPDLARLSGSGSPPGPRSSETRNPENTETPRVQRRSVHTT